MTGFPSAYGVSGGGSFRLGPATNTFTSTTERGQGAKLGADNAGNDSPTQENEGVVTYLLSYTAGYVPEGGAGEYRVARQQLFDGKTKASANKVPDPFAALDIRARGEEVMYGFWLGIDLPISDRVTPHETLDEVFHLLTFGDAAEDLYKLDNIPTDSLLTLGMKTALYDNIEAILDDYPHLKMTP